MWPPITSETIIHSFSPSLGADYQQWITANPDKTERLNKITAMTVAEFRAALASNPENGMDPIENTLPPSCLRHTINLIIFQLKSEMGKALSESENGANIRADVFLRGIWIGSIPAAKTTHIQSPSYSK